ncbi:hypothetical protein BH23ACT3_BH23ACT3_05330 [soil metagenome]
MVPAAGHTGAPPGREVAVEVEPLGRRGCRNREAVVVHHGALVEQSVALRSGGCAVRRDGNEQPSVLRVCHPCPVAIRDAHLEDPTVAVDVFHDESRPLVTIGPRPRPSARTTMAGTIGEHPLGAVGIDPGNDVEGAGTQRLHHLGLATSVAVHEVLEQMARRHGRGELHGVDAGVDPMCGLGVVLAGRSVGHGDEQQVTPLVRAPVRLDRDETGVGLGQLVQAAGQFLVPEVPIEVVDHRRILRWAP